MSELFFENQILAQQQYQERDLPPEIILNKVITKELSDTQIEFIQSVGFCFIASSNKQGQCDCSFRGSELGEDGSLLPLLTVKSPNEIHLPDFAGNGMFDSIGNFMDNPNIGMIFISFEKAIRLRVNAKVKILEPSKEHLNIWPSAKRILKITTERCYFNCNKRIKQSFKIGE